MNPVKLFSINEKYGFGLGGIGLKRMMIGIMALCLMLMIAMPVWGKAEKTKITGKPGGTWQVESGEKAVGKDETISKDLIFNGEELEVDGVVQGDLIILAGDVIINGDIEGSVIGLTGGKITVNGRIKGNLRAMAQEIYINGSVDGSTTVGAFQMITSPNSRIGNGLMGTFLMLELAGQVDQIAEVTSLSFTKIGGRINGDLEVAGNQLKWVPPLEVSGKVIDSSGKANNPSKVKGIKIRDYQFKKVDLAEQFQYAKVFLIGLFIWMVGGLLLSLIFYRLFPRITWSMTEPTMANFRRNLLVGFLCLIGIPVAIYFLFLSVVGIPVAVFLLLLYLLLLAGFEIPVCLWLGRLVFKSKLRPGLMIFLGAVLQIFIFFTPPLNVIATPVLLCLGIGMIAGKIRFQFRENPNIIRE